MVAPTQPGRAGSARRSLPRALAALLLLGACAEAAGQAGPPAAPPLDECPAEPIDEARAVAVSVYNPDDSNGGRGFAVVKERRRVTLSAGPNEVRLGGVSADLDASTVRFASLTDPAGTKVLEQSFEYDLASADRVLERYVGREIAVRRAGGEERGALVAFDAQAVTLSSAGAARVIPRAEAALILDELPGGLLVEPTLVWAVEAARAGEHEIELSYQTPGLSWVADYSLVVSEDGKSGDLSAWVTLSNGAGSFPDARLKLIAGAVHLAPASRYDLDYLYQGPLGGALKEQPAFEERSFFEYHLYTLSRPTDLFARSVKQLELFKPRAGAASRRLLFDSYEGYAAAGKSALGAAMEITLKNDAASGLGIPLPAGRVRVYQRDDADGGLELIGEDRIAHTPKGDEVKLRLGRAFDVVGERRQVSYTGELYGATEVVEWKLRNRGERAEAAVVREHGYGAWEIVDASEKFTKIDAGTAELAVTLAPGEEKIVRLTTKSRW